MRRKIEVRLGLGPNLSSYETRCRKRAMNCWKLRRITTRNVLSGSFQFSLIVIVLKKHSSIMSVDWKKLQMECRLNATRWALMRYLGRSVARPTFTTRANDWKTRETKIYSLKVYLIYLFVFRSFQKPRNWRIQGKNGEPFRRPCFENTFRPHRTYSR